MGGIESGYGVRARKTGGFAANIEVIPASCISLGIVQPSAAGSSSEPNVFFAIVLPDAMFSCRSRSKMAGSHVMRFTAAGDVPGVKGIFHEHIAPVTGRTSDASTPLHVAAAAGQLDACRYLLGHGANVARLRARRSQSLASSSSMRLPRHFEAASGI